MCIDKCECGVGEQSVEHVLLRCALAEGAREKAEAALKEGVSMVNLLYTEKGWSGQWGFGMSL